MNEAFDKMIEIQTINNDTRKGRELALYNLIDVGTITSVSGNRCCVQSYRVMDGRNIVYDSLELCYPGGVGSVNPEGMTCIVLFPPETTNLKDKTISVLRPYFSMMGGKVIPITVDGDCKVNAGPLFDGSFCFSSDLFNVRLAEDAVTISIGNGSILSLKGDANSLSLSMFSNTVRFYYDNQAKQSAYMILNNGVPSYYEFHSYTKHWIGHNGYKNFKDVQYNIFGYVEVDFNFVEYYINTERWLYIHDSNGTQLCAIGIDNTGEILVETAEDITVDRDGTKLEVKDGKVVVTGDLEVSGKTTITGMSTDLKNFLTVLMSGLTPMYTLGSPATHQPDANYKSKMTQAQGYL